MYGIHIKKAIIKEIYKKSEGIDYCIVKMENGENVKAINYPKLSGNIKTGDNVLLNTTAVDLGLGTGGFHIIVFNIYTEHKRPDYPGHIMKLRYTPLQIRTLTVEEEDSPYREEFLEFKDLNTIPVIIIPLHSLLAPVAIVFRKFFPDKRLIYIMTEGGSLALEMSDLIKDLQKNNYINNTISIGHAFGGDFETINIFSGLATAYKVAKADLIVVGMGPGISGTGTKYGFSGLENLFIAQAVDLLNGINIVVPRISIAEKRKRHYLISHHSLTFMELCKVKTEFVFPDLNPVKGKILEFEETIQINNIHNVFYYKIDDIYDILINSGFEFNSMGRSLMDDPIFFITAGLAIYRVREYLKGDE